jgi:4'-phosphopantetheinyl transferase EntD
MEYRFEVPHGYCAILDGAGPTTASLIGEERALEETLSEHRLHEFVLGRLALRTGLHHLIGHAPMTSILSDSRGAPILPAGWVGSISHKAGHAAGLVAPDTGARVGVDLELAAPPRVDIGPRVLTAAEHGRIARLPPDAYGRAVTLRFAIKEAIYKAVDPFVRRYVGFQEVELDVHDDGGCAVSLVEPARLPVVIDAAWRTYAGFWLATARAKPRAG